MRVHPLLEQTDGMGAPVGFRNPAAVVDNVAGHRVRLLGDIAATAREPDAWFLSLQLSGFVCDVRLQVQVLKGQAGQRPFDGRKPLMKGIDVLCFLVDIRRLCRNCPLHLSSLLSGFTDTRTGDAS
jgi:hypothetical protein